LIFSQYRKSKWDKYKKKDNITMEKVALVTGSSSGIGLETALALARDGYETYASMRDVKKSAELEYAAKKENIKIKIIELDVDKE